MNTAWMTKIPQLLFKKDRFSVGITRYIKKEIEANRNDTMKWFLVVLMSFLMFFFVSLFFTPAVFEMTVRLNPIENIMPVIEYRVLAALSLMWKSGKIRDKTIVIPMQTAKM